MHYMMEENWLYEALTENLPLLSLFDNLIDDGVPRLTMSLTPPLCSMLVIHCFKSDIYATLTN